MPTDAIREAMTPGTVTTLGQLRPGDVGAFIPESEWFVVYETWPSGKVVVQYDDDHGAAPCLPTRKVRYLGRGRIEPARIVMDGEVGLAQNGLLDWHPLSVGLQGVWATTDFATFEVSSNPHSWGWEVETINKIESGECDSLADGKEKAEQWYRDRLAAALEPIIPMEAHHADN